MDRPFRLGVEDEDRAQLGVTGKHEFQPVFFGRVEGLFVRLDRAGGKILQFGQGEKAKPDFIVAAF